MMYIRTKDGIHSVEAVPLSNGRIRYSLSNEDSLISKEDFEKITIREADTIEELCDEFVLHNDNTTKLWLCEPYDLINEYLREGINHRYTIYGAIWTEWGLKYVAKMDNEGKLELI